jgi:hypothetical protein
MSPVALSSTRSSIWRSSRNDEGTTPLTDPLWRPWPRTLSVTSTLTIPRSDVVTHRRSYVSAAGVQADHQLHVAEVVLQVIEIRLKSGLPLSSLASISTTQRLWAMPFALHLPRSRAARRTSSSRRRRRRERRGGRRDARDERARVLRTTHPGAAACRGVRTGQRCPRRGRWARR